MKRSIIILLIAIASSFAGCVPAIMVQAPPVGVAIYPAGPRYHYLRPHYYGYYSRPYYGHRHYGHRW